MFEYNVSRTLSALLHCLAQKRRATHDTNTIGPCRRPGPGCRRAARDGARASAHRRRLGNPFAATAAEPKNTAAMTAPPDGREAPHHLFWRPPGRLRIANRGTAILWSAEGHHVKFVSVTNGDIGHWREAGGPLAVRPKPRSPGPMPCCTSPAGARHSRRRVVATMENRRTITRLIREWQRIS